MFKSLKRSLQNMNNDQFDRSLYKVVCDKNVKKPKEKHINLLVECLKGENSRVLPLDAFTRITDQILAINFFKWVNAAKWCYVLHVSIYSNCKLFVEAMCFNGVFTRIKQHQSPPKTQDIFIYIHTTLTLNYFSYLQNRYENLFYLQNAMDEFDQKEEAQKSLIIHKMLQTIQLIVKVEKELDISLQKFPQFELIKHIGQILLRDLTFFYPIAATFVGERVDTLLTSEIILANRNYQNYVDLIRVSRHVKQMMKLKPLLTEGMRPEDDQQIVDIKVFTIDLQKNQEIELYFTNLKAKKRVSAQLDNSKDLIKKISDEEQNNSKELKKHCSEDSQQENINIPTMIQQISINDMIDIVDFSEEKLSRVEVMDPYIKNSHSNYQFQKLAYLSSEVKQNPNINIYSFEDDKSKSALAKLNESVEPDRIKLSSQHSNTNAGGTRLSRRQPISIQKQKGLENFVNNDAVSYQSTNTQQSFISEYSEARVLGLKRQSSIKGHQERKKNDFYTSKDSPIGFISFQLEILSQQASIKNIADEKISNL